MCFYHDDYDWIAEICETTAGVSPLAAKCDECGKRILAFEWRCHVYQQEHEECQRCEYEELEPDDEPCQTHDYGETFNYDRCEDCDKIIRAIEQYELREGCKPHESRPALCDLKEELNPWNRDDAPLYAAVAIEMFPELGDVPWLVDVLTRHISC